MSEVNIDELIDQVEYEMYMSGQFVEMPLVHKFIPGIYIREIFMPKGTKIVSQVHSMYNPYFIMKGKVSVFSANDGEQILKAGDKGITTPFTRRLLYIHQDAVWVTCHVTDVFPENDSKEAFDAAVLRVEDQITVPYVNKLLGGRLRNNVLIPMIENKEVLLIEEEDINVYS